MSRRSWKFGFSRVAGLWDGVLTRKDQEQWKSF